MHCNNKKIERFVQPDDATIRSYPVFDSTHPTHAGETRWPHTPGYSIQTQCTGSTGSGCAFGHCMIDGSTFDHFWTTVLSTFVDEIADRGLTVSACQKALTTIAGVTCTAASAETLLGAFAIGGACALVAYGMCTLAAAIGAAFRGGQEGNPSWRGSDLYREMLMRDSCNDKTGSSTYRERFTFPMGTSRALIDAVENDSGMRREKMKLKKLYEKYGAKAAKDGLQTFLNIARTKRSKENYYPTGKCAQGTSMLRHPVYTMWRGVASTIVEVAAAGPPIGSSAACAAAWIGITAAVTAAIEAGTAGFGTPAAAWFVANSAAIGSVFCLALGALRSQTMTQWGTDGWKQALYDQLCSADFI